MVSSQFQNNCRLFHSKQEAIRIVSRCESLQMKWYWFISFLTFTKLRFPPKLLCLPKNTACKENVLHYTSSLTQCWKYMMAIQTRIQLKLQEIPESSSIVLGMEGHQHYNLTGSRWKFGKIQTIYTKKKS